MMLPDFRSVLTLAMAGVTFSAAAQEQPVPATEVIEVTGSAVQLNHEIPAAVTSLSVDEQPPGLRIDAAELLGGIAGVQADSRANYAQDTRITLRRFGARSAFGVRGVLLQLDGIPLSMPDGQAQTSSILLDEPEEVQVIRGPLASLYGNGAGGVIDWHSRAPDTNQLTLKAMGAANDTSRLLLQGDLVGDDHALRLIGARFRTDGPREHNSAERDQLALRWYQDLTNTLRLVVRMDDNHAPELQDPGSLTPADWRADPDQTFSRADTFNTRKSIHHQQLSVSLQQETLDNRWHVSAWRGWRDIEQYLPFAGDDLTSSGAVIDLQRQFSGIDAAYNWRLALPITATLGGTIAEQEDRRFGYVNDFGQRGELRRDELGTVTNQALYGLLEWQPAQQWHLLTGLRYSAVDFNVDDYYTNPVNPDDSGAQDMNALSWNLGVTYLISDQLSIFAARGRGFETPTLTELAYSPQGTGLNTRLGPAYSQQWETGLKWRSPGLRTQLTAFIIDTDDEIVVDQSIDGRTTYINAGQTEREGAELEGEWQIAAAWDLRFAASWLNAEYANGNRLPGVARQQAYAQLNWSTRPLAQLPIQASLIADHRGDIAATDDNSVLAPGHTLWDLALSSQTTWQGLDIEPWLKIHNLGDRDYVGSVVVNQGSGRAFEPGVGREIQAGFSVSHRW